MPPITVPASRTGSWYGIVVSVYRPSLSSVVSDGREW